MTDQTEKRDRFEELCAGYVLNALDPDEKAEFERLLDDADEEEMELYRKLRSASNNLALAGKPSEPSGDVKKQLFEVIEDDLEASESNGGAEGSARIIGFDREKFAFAASFALLIITFSLVFYAFNLSTKLQGKEELIDTYQNQVTELKNRIEQKNELLAILESRQIDMVVLKGMEANPGGYGKIIWDAKQQQALLQVSNLPPVPENKEYQLWAIKGNKPISAGLFAVKDPKEDAFFKIEQMEGVEDEGMNAFAVTLEPKGGMPQPTGDTYLMGNMDK